MDFRFLDASNYGIGAIISRFLRMEVKKKQTPRASSSPAPNVCNYSQTETEAQVVVSTINKFHEILYGQHFTLITKNKTLGNSLYQR